MTTDNPTATTESEPETFDTLDNRFMSIMSRFQVLKEVMGVDEVPKELAPAAYVLEETVDDVVHLFDDLQGSHEDHEHTAKAPKAVQS